MSELDKIETALINGYTAGQALTLNRWSNDEVKVFMEGVIRGDGEETVLVYTDGSVEKIKPKLTPVESFWKKSSYGEGEFCAAEKEPDLARQCKIKGNVRNGLYTFSLSQNGKWLKRKHN